MARGRTKENEEIGSQKRNESQNRKGKRKTKVQELNTKFPAYSHIWKEEENKSNKRQRDNNILKGKESKTKQINGRPGAPKAHIKRETKTKPYQIIRQGQKTNNKIKQ